MQKHAGLALRLRDFWLRRVHPSQPPFRLWVDITSQCNLECPACAQRLLTPKERGPMHGEILSSLLEQIRGGIGEVNFFHRGEPLLHPRFGYWAEKFAATEALVRVHSNCTLLGEKKVTQVLDSGLDLFTCSIDTLEKKDYAARRRGGDLERALAGLERLLRARGQRGQRRPVITLLLMGRQERGPEYVMRLGRLKSLGLDRVVRREEHNWGGYCGPPPKSRTRPAVCTFPWYGLAVLSDGRVTPCPQDFGGELTLGRVQDASLEKIWQGNSARDLRRAHGQKNPSCLPPACRDCDRIWRETLCGLPLEHLKNFLSESIVRTPR